MKGFKAITGLMVLTLCLGGAYLLYAQNAEAFMSKLKVDDWVRIKGIPQEDSSILLKEVKIIYGEVENDDWEIRGIINRVVPEEMKIFILDLPVKFDKDTRYKSFASFSAIEAGVHVEIEGSFLQDGTFMATEIEKEKVKEGEQNMIKWKGRVQSVNQEENSFTMLGHTVIFTPETKVKSLVHN